MATSQGTNHGFNESCDSVIYEKVGGSAGGLNEGAVSGALGSGDGNIDLGAIMSKLDVGGLANGVLAAY
ncbi:MAG: hypothetical protein ACI915_000992 [Gammaproteobacteria bacterium]